MGERTQAMNPTRKLISTRRGSLKTGLNPYTSRKAAEAVGLEVV